MINQIREKIKQKDDIGLIKLMIELYVNYDVRVGYEDIVYELFDYTLTYFEHGQFEKFMQLSETVSNLAYEVGSVKSMRLYYEINSAMGYILNDYGQTKTILEEYVTFCEENDLEEYLKFIIGNISTIELDEKDYEAAKATLERVFEVSKDNINAVYYINSARLLLEQGQTEGVIGFLDKGLKMPELQTNYTNKIETYLHYATYYMLEDNKEMSIWWYKSTIDLIEKHELGFEERRVYKSIANLLESYGMYKESNEYLKKYVELAEQAVEKDRRLMSTKSKLQVYISEKELENKRLKQRNEDIKLENNLDYLTKIYNRRYITKYIQKINQKEKILFSLLIFDIDHFKQINDTYGHLAGDYVIRELCDVVNTLVTTEIFARTGGDEFIILFENTRKDQALVLANQIRQDLSAHVFEYESERINLTISGGIKEVTEKLNYSDILRDADVLLYRSKRNGKNQIN